jgi:hypothetical protein
VSRIDVSSGAHSRSIIRALSREVELDDGPAAASAKSVPADVDEDPLEPGLEPGRIAQGPIPSPCAHHGIVGRVLGFDRIAQDDGGQPICTIEVMVRELSEGGSLVHPRSRMLGA